MVRPFRLVLIMLLLLPLACSRKTHGDSLVEGQLITSVSIQIDRPDWIEQSRLRNYLQARGGSRYSIATTDNDIRALYESGFVDDVKISIEPKPFGISVIYKVEARKPISVGPGFILEGNYAFSDAHLAKLISGMLPHDSEGAGAKIQSLYLEHGFPDAAVRLVALEGAMDIHCISITEGERSGSLEEP